MAAHLGSAWIPCSRNSSVATLVASRRIYGCRPSRPRRRKLTVDVSEGSAPLPQLHQIADLGHEHVLLLDTLRCRAMSTRSINSVTRQRFVVRCFWLDNFARNQYKITR